MNPYKTDYLYRILRMFGRDKPILTGLIYFVLSIGSIYLVGYLTGDLHGCSEKGIKPFYMHPEDNISVGLLAPIGAALLCYLYNQICNVWKYLRESNILASGAKEELDRLEKRFEKSYNRIPVIIIALLISLFFNIFAYIYQADGWLGINGGITAIYARIFIVINFFMIGLVFYKSIVTFVALKKILKLELIVQPIHPDRAGGLKPFGNLSLAVFYFLTLVSIYFSLLIMLDKGVKEHLVYYVPVFMLYYVTTPLLLFLSLSNARRQMVATKSDMLKRLSFAFSQNYRTMVESSPTQGEFDLSVVEDMRKIHSVYIAVEKMPTLPLSIGNITRFFTTNLIPVFIVVIKILLSNGIKLFT